jgi:hypothetical protein
MITQLPPSPEEQHYHDALRNEQEYEWKDDVIKLVCTSDIPEHEAYGLNFLQYNKRRSFLHTKEDDESVRVGFRMTDLYATMTLDLATQQNLPPYRFIILILELGLIHFQHNYHDKVETVRALRDASSKMVSNPETERLYMTSKKITVSMGSIKTSKLFTPTLPKWLGNAIKNSAMYVNMSTSEFAFLCWCIGVSNTIPGLQTYIENKLYNDINNFEYEFNNYIESVESTHNKMKGLL